jgi:hypothetical protein
MHAYTIPATPQQASERHVIGPCTGEYTSRIITPLASLLRPSSGGLLLRERLLHGVFPIAVNLEDVWLGAGGRFRGLLRLLFSHGAHSTVRRGIMTMLFELRLAGIEPARDVLGFGGRAPEESKSSAFTSFATAAWAGPFGYGPFYALRPSFINGRVKFRSDCCCHILSTGRSCGINRSGASSRSKNFSGNPTMSASSQS